MGVEGCPTKPELERLSPAWKSPAAEVFCGSRSWDPLPFYLRQPQLSSLSSPRQLQVRGKTSSLALKMPFGLHGSGGFALWHSHSCSFARLHAAAQLWSTARVLSPLQVPICAPPPNPKHHLRQHQPLAEPGEMRQHGGKAAAPRKGSSNPLNPQMPGTHRAMRQLGAPPLQGTMLHPPASPSSPSHKRSSTGSFSALLSGGPATAPRCPPRGYGCRGEPLPHPQRGTAVSLGAGGCRSCSSPRTGT